MNKKKLFIGIGIFWIVIFGGFIAVKEYTLITGEEVLLRTRPVDPRDLFRGDYVILSYEISRIDTEGLSFQGNDFEEGDNIYVLLEIDNDKIGSLAGVRKSKPSEGTFIKGTVKSKSNTRLIIEYGIESYFVPEGKGKEIERNLRNMYVKVAIDDFGTAVIKSLVLDGEDVDVDK